jgi:hypothetical protein
MEQERGLEHDWLFLEVEKIWPAKTKEGCCAVLCKEQGGGVWQRFLTSCTVKKIRVKRLSFNTKIKQFYVRDAFFNFPKKNLVGCCEC